MTGFLYRMLGEQVGFMMLEQEGEKEKLVKGGKRANLMPRFMKGMEKSTACSLS